MNFLRLAAPLWAVAAHGDSSYTMSGTFPDVYNPQKQVPVFVGRVEKEAPFQYFDFNVLPICDFLGVNNDKLANITDTLGARLAGHSWTFNPRLPIIFGENLENTTVCKLSITSDVMREATQMVMDGGRITYWVDGLPSVGYIGVEKSGMFYLYKHRHFDIVVRNNGIVGFDVIPSEPMQIVLNSRMEMTFSVKFVNADELINSPFQNTTEGRYERYLSSPETETLNQQRIDTFNLVNAAGFTCIAASLSGLIFQRFLADKKPGSQEESAWSVTARIPNLSVLRSQVYRRPRHAVIISIFIALGAQVLTSTLAFWIFTSFGLSTSDLVFRQLDGHLNDPIMGCFLGSSVFGGIAGGNFIKAWGIRRHGMAYWAQVGLPFLVISIVLIQFRTVSIMVGTTLAWSFMDCCRLIGLAMANAAGHLFGFSLGHKFSSTLELKCPSDIDGEAQVADAPEKGRFKRAVLLCIPPVLANSIVSGPLFVSYRCAIMSFCVKENLNSLFLHLICTWILLGATMIITTFLLLCLGDGRWQWNAARTGIIHGILQTVFMALWSVRSYAPYTMYSSAYAFGVNLLLGSLTCCASTMICYYCSSTILLTIYDDQKAE